MNGLSKKPGNEGKRFFSFFLFLILIIIFTQINLTFASGKNYVYRTKNGTILLTDQPVRNDYAELLRVFESKKKVFYVNYGEYYRDKYDPIIRRHAQLNGLEPALVHAVIKYESAYDYTAVSPAGAKGLMQLMDATAEELGVMNVFDPEENIRAGTEYLAKLLNRYAGNLNHALAAYNAGPTKVDLYKGIPPYSETRRYIKRIKAELNGRNVVSNYYELPEPEKTPVKPSLTWKKVNGKLVIVEDTSKR